MPAMVAAHRRDATCAVADSMALQELSALLFAADFVFVCCFFADVSLLFGAIFSVTSLFVVAGSLFVCLLLFFVVRLLFVVYFVFLLTLLFICLYFAVTLLFSICCCR